MNPQTSTYLTLEEKRKIVRQFTGTSGSTPLQDLVKYTQILGSFLIKGMNNVLHLFKKSLFKDTPASVVTPQNEATKEKQSEGQPKRAHFKVNFKQFQCDDAMLDEIETPKLPEQLRPVRSYKFMLDGQNNGKSADGSEIKEDTELNLNEFSNGRKKIKENNEFPTKPSAMSTWLKLETKEERQHWNEVYNEANKQLVIAVLTAKEKYQKQKRKEGRMPEEQTYKKYLKSLGGGIANNLIGQGNSKLGQLIKEKRLRQKIDYKPPRKRLHIQEETPPIYSVQKVLEVLEKQRQQFLQEKKKQQQQQRRKQQQQRRIFQLKKWQEQQQRQQLNRKEQQEKKQKQQELIKLEQKRRQEQKSQKLEKQALQRKQHQNQLNQIKPDEQRSLEAASQNEKPNENLGVISQREELLEGSQLDNRQQKDNVYLSVRRERKGQDSKQQLQGSLSPSKQQVSNKQEAAPQIFATPKKAQEPEKNQLTPLVNVSDSKPSEKKINPFIRNSPAKPVQLGDFIKNNPKADFLQTSLLNASNNVQPLNHIFNQQNPVSNIFASKIGQLSQQPGTGMQYQPEKQYTSPNNFLNNPIKTNFMPMAQPSQLVPPTMQNNIPGAQGMAPFISPTNLGNNFLPSGQTPNMMGLFSSHESQPNPNPLQQFSGSHNLPFVQPAGNSAALNMFSNAQGNGAARLFENNLFMTNPAQPMSLFGAPPSSGSRDSTSNRYVDRKSKKQVRIT